MRPISPELEMPHGPLVTGDWLQDHLGHPMVRVLDVRGRHPSSPLPHAKRAEYAAGHIPGAVFVDWEHDFIDASDPVPAQVAGAEAFAERAGELGVGDGDLIVTYDDYYGIFAARVAWAFRYYGAESRVLDGGWSTWREDRRAVSDASEMPERRTFTARPRPRLRRTLTDVEAATAGARRLWMPGRDTCSSASVVLRTPATFPARAACPTRSWSMARPGCGRRRRRSGASRWMRGSTRTDRRGS